MANEVKVKAVIEVDAMELSLVKMFRLLRSQLPKDEVYYLIPKTSWPVKIKD